MSEYLRLRAENIARNEAFLARLGLSSSAQTFSAIGIKKKQSTSTTTTETTTTSSTTQSTAKLINSNENVARTFTIKTDESTNHEMRVYDIRPSIYQCINCRLIIGDDSFVMRCVPVLSVTAANTIFFNTQNVVVDTTNSHFSSKGDDIGCVYYDLKCSCGVTIGRQYKLTTAKLDILRDCFIISNLALSTFFSSSLRQSMSKVSAEAASHTLTLVTLLSNLNQMISLTKQMQSELDTTTQRIDRLCNDVTSRIGLESKRQPIEELTLFTASSKPQDESLQNFIVSKKRSRTINHNDNADDNADDLLELSDNDDNNASGKTTRRKKLQRLVVKVL